MNLLTLREKCPYFELFSPNAEKYGPEQLRIRTLFTQREAYMKFNDMERFPNLLLDVY